MGAGASIGRLVPAIEETAALVQKISGASREQSEGAREIHLAIRQLNDLAQRYSTASTELDGRAEGLSAQAERLKSTVAFFRLGDAPGESGDGEVLEADDGPPPPGRAFT